MTQPTWSRRRFLQASAGAGITIATIPLQVQASESFAARETMPGGADWTKAPAVPRYRIDGVAKVTGQKLYARDFRAKDMPGWPQTTAHAALLFAPDAKHLFQGIDLSPLGSDLQPDLIVTAEDLANAEIVVGGFFASDLFCPQGTVPAYLGQPVALVIYNDLGRFAVARAAMRGRSDLIKFGAEAPRPEPTPFGANRFTRIGGATPRDPDFYSPVLAGWVSPVRFQKSEAPIWAPASNSGDAAAKASEWGEEIRAELKGDSLKTYAQTFATQSIDQVFMEPECGLAWFDKSENRLALVLDVQSPEACAQAVASMLNGAATAVKPAHIDCHFAYLGGGFGGKDHTIYPLYVAVAGLFADGKAVRLANDRFDQFQFGLKRHAFEIEQQLGVDPQTGKFIAFASDMSCDGGGLANFSASVADVAATAATSIYYLPKSDITTVATQSRAVTAGSMRGYGTLQSMSALECLVDEIAEDLGRDPIELRKLNSLKTGEKNLAGNIPSGQVRTDEVLDRLAAHPLWTGRTEDKKRYEAANPGKSYAVGVACVMKDFGTGADGVLAALELNDKGEIELWSNSIEMGTGISSAVAVRAADYLGSAAHQVHLGGMDVWAPLKLVTSGNPWGISQADQNTAAQNPRWVPTINSPASASIGAHVNTHAVAEAARVVLEFGLWPAAKAIWSEGVLGGADAGEVVRFGDLRWVDGKLTGSGMPPLSLAQLTAKAREQGFVTGAMVHAFNRWKWAKADFMIEGTRYTGVIDALAVKQGGGDWSLLDRVSVDFPGAEFERVGVNYYAACGALVALAVTPGNGAVDLLAVHEVLECGRPIVPELVNGIAEGGIAMGLGQALHEYLPLYEDGPGNGTWNLNRYHVPRAADLPVWRTTVETLAPISDTDPPKGMAEVVSIPVIPAALNAIAAATGKRFRTLPVTSDRIAEALK